jgi:hypothetical protein
MRPVVWFPAPLTPGPVARTLLLVAVLTGACSADSGPKGILPGNALGKLCHALNRSGNPVTLTLQMGDPAIVSITAVTGACSPPLGEPCTMIPVGKVPLKLFEGDRLLLTRSVILTAAPAGSPLNEYVFEPVLTTSLQVAITGGRIAPGTCQGLELPGPDGGVGDGGRDGSALEAGAGEAGVEAGPTDAALEGGASDVAAAADGVTNAPTDVPAAPDAAADASAD